MNKVVIFTEAGEKIGFGHYTRCLALFKGLLLKTKAKMLLNVHGNFNPDPNVIVLDWNENKDYLKGIAVDYDSVIIDSYLATEDFYFWLFKFFKRVFIIDDYKRLNFPVDSVIINPNIFGDELNYGLPDVLGGIEYIILREEFRNEVKKKENRVEVKKS